MFAYSFFHAKDYISEIILQDIGIFCKIPFHTGIPVVYFKRD